MTPAVYLEYARLMNGACPTCGKIYSAHRVPRCSCQPLTYPEPKRDSLEADAVHGPTALGKHHDNTSQEDRPGSDSSRP